MRSLLFRASGLLLLTGAACSARESEGPVRVGSLPLVARFPALSPLLARALDAPAWKDGERLRVSSSGRLALTAGATSDGAFDIGVKGSAQRIPVRRIESTERVRLDAGTIAWGERAVMFARGAALEDIIVAPSDADVGYDLALPP